MCGIFGCIGHIDKDVAYECISKLKHRGPDYIGVEQLPGVTLAHARLSIIDVSEQANQPMFDESGRYCIVYNGEVYNFIELRDELKAKGYKFITDSDTEVVLKAYIEWGDDFQDKCNGMWALAIWDNVEKKLLFSRDRFGIKPLYYLEQNGNFYFASEMKAFFPVLDNRRIYYRIFEEKNYFGYESTEKCIFRNIKRIKPGYCGEYSDGVLTQKCWWSTIEHLMDVPDSYSEQVEMLRDLFTDACRIRMRSDVPIGTALSGGVDSSAVAGMMRHLVDKEYSDISDAWQNLFVASMPGTIIDETRYAEIVSEHIGIELNKVRIHPENETDKLLDYIYLCEDPYITSPIPFFQTYGSIHDSGVKVTLDGHGADELFGGYYFDLFSIIGNGNEIKTDDINTVLEAYNNSNANNPLSFENFVKEARKSRSASLTYIGESLKNLDDLNKKLYLETHREVLPTLLRNYDRYSMGNSVEIRMPFMDYRIVCFAFSIGWKSKIRGGFTKRIVRDMASPYMDSRIMYRKDKIGFNSPMSEWARGEMKEFILDTVNSRDFLECELIENPLAVAISVERIMDNNQVRYEDGEDLWVKIMPYLWKRAMFR